MATYQSISSNVDNNPSSGGSLTITNPSGLAAGDTMYASIFAESGGGGSSNVSVATPSGWTLEAQESRSTDDAHLYVYRKVATSDDVSAGSVSFVVTGSSIMSIGGHVVRLSSVGIEAGQVDEIDTGITNTTTVAGFTPSRANCLFLAFLAQDNTATHNTISSIAMATSNPTWTSRAASVIRDTSGGYYANLATFTATRPEATATGDFTVTYSSSDSKNGFSVIIAVSPQVNGSITQESKLNAYALSPISNTQLDAIVEDPTLTERGYTAWTNEAAPTTTWTKENI